MAIPGNFLSSTTESVTPNTSGWRTRLNCTQSLGTGGRNGDGCLKLTSVAAGEFQAETVTAYPVTAGETYLTFADASSSTQPERIGIEWLTSALVPVGSITWSMTTATASTSWHRVSVAGVCPAGATRARVVLSANAGAAGRLHYWENLYLGAPIRTVGNLLPFNVESGGELNTSGWTAETNATVGRTAPAVTWTVGWYLSGGHVMTMTAVAAGNAAMRLAERAVAKPGIEYLAYAYLGPPTSGSTAWIELRYYSEAGALLLAKRATLAAPGTGLSRQRASGIAPDGTAEVEIAVGLDGASAGQVLRVEGVVITVAPELRTGTVMPYEDGSFESGVGQWVRASGAGTIARTSPWGTASMEGSYSLQVSSAATGTTVLHSATYPVSELVSWRAEFSMLHAAGASAWTIDIGIRWYDASGTEISLSGMDGADPLPTDGTWWVIWTDRTAPAGAATARVELSVQATAASSVLYVDRAALRQVLPSTEVVPDPEQARITLTLRELTPGRLLTVWREDTDGHRTLVRGEDGLLDGVELAAEVLVVEDYEAPLGVPVSYYAEMRDAASGAYTGSRSTSPVVIEVPDGNWAWLKDPSAPRRNLQVLMRSAPDWTRPIVQAEYRVRGRRNPVVLSDVRGGLTGALTVSTETDEQRAALHLLLDSGQVLLWQAAPGHGVDDMYVTVGEATEARDGGDATDPWRVWTLPVTQVDMPTAGLSGTAGWSGYDVLALFETSADLLAAYDTSEQLMLGPPPTGR